MAGRWEDDGEWRERDAQFGRGYPGEDNEPPRDRYRGTEQRSFQRDPRGPVFGERESGASYTDPREARDGYAGGTGRYGSPIRAAARYYGGPRDHTEAERTSAYRAAYGAQADPRDTRYRSYEAGDGDEARFYRDREDHDGSQGRTFLDRAADSVASWFSDRRPDFRRPVHRGLGPQGYTRPDERITDEVHERLTEDPWLDASRITIAVTGGEVTLSGTVTERDAKHRAERLVEDLAGVTHVQNNLRVDRGDGRPATSVQTASLKGASADRRNGN